MVKITTVRGTLIKTMAAKTMMGNAIILTTEMVEIMVVNTMI